MGKWPQRLSAWGKWLGAGLPKVSRMYQGLRNIILGLAGLVGVGTVIRLAYLIRQLLTGRKQWTWRLSVKPGIWGYIGIALSFLASIVIIGSWWLVVHPIVSTIVPGEAIWLTLAVTGWFLLGAVAIMIRKEKIHAQVS